MSLIPSAHHVGATPTTYYVDATGGSDSNNGTSTLTAWQTIAKINSSSFTAGDSVLFKRGEIWRNEQITQTASLTYGAYGSGAAPSIRGSLTYDNPGDWTNESGNLWYISGITNDPIVFAHDSVLGLRKTTKVSLAGQWQYWYDSGTSRLYIYSVSNPTSSAALIEAAIRDRAFDYVWWNNVTIQDLDFRQFRDYAIIGFFGGSTGWVIQRTNFAQTAGYGIQFNGFTGNLTATVDNSTFTDWGIRNGQDYAIQTIANDGDSARVDVTNSTFTINHSMNTTEIGGVMSDTNGWVRTFTGNTLINNGNWPGVGMELWRPSANATTSTIANNSAYRIGSFSFGIQELEFHGATPTVIVRDNYMEDSDTNDVLDTEALRVRDFSSASNVEVSYNVINGTTNGSFDHAGIYLYNADNAKIYNNTIYGADQGLWVKQGTTGADIRNNIATNGRTYGVRLEDVSTITTFNHNLFFANTTANYSGIAAGAGDVTTDPLLQNGGGGVFKLQSGSPAINAGTSVSLTADYEGTVVPQGASADLGAYEFHLPATPTIPAQYKADGVTSLATGALTNQSSTVHKLTMGSLNVTDSFTPEFEVEPVGTGFTNVATATGSAAAFAGSDIVGSATQTGLLTATSYHWQARSVNSAGASAWVAYGGNAESAADFLTDLNAPVISAVGSTPSTTTATITWTTDELASSQVEYGLTTAYGNATVVADTPTGVTAHSVGLSSLTACKTYHYRVISADAVSNQTTDTDNTFATEDCPVVVPPVTPPPAATKKKTTKTTTTSTKDETPVVTPTTTPVIEDTTEPVAAPTKTSITPAAAPVTETEKTNYTPWVVGGFSFLGLSGTVTGVFAIIRRRNRGGPTNFQSGQ